MTTPSTGGRSVLVVAQYAPPSSLVASRRVAAMAKYLGRAGHSVTVLTSIASGEGEIEGAEKVVRTKDALTSGLNWRRGHFAALEGRVDAQYKPPSRLASVVVPDLALGTWLPFALPAARKLARERRFDCVLTSAPPPSTQLVGLALRRRGIPWIAELRDGWTFEPPHAPWPLRVQRRLDEAMERRVLGKADAVIAVTEPIVADLRGRLGLDAELISNGHDPEDAPVGVENLFLRPDRHSIVHTGRLTSGGRPLGPLLEAVRILRAEQPGIAARLELVFAGSATEAERRQLTASDLADTVRFAGWLERPRALALQRSADTLLVLTGTGPQRSVATGKLFEYLAAGRPILVLGEETEAARIVIESGSGTATSVSEPHAIAASFRQLVEDPLPAPPSAAADDYAYPRLIERLEAVIERVSSA